MVKTVCLWCNGFHANSRCPRVKAFEYGENGAVSRVEFWDEERAEKVINHLIDDVKILNQQVTELEEALQDD